MADISIKSDRLLPISPEKDLELGEEQQDLTSNNMQGEQQDLTSNKMQGGQQNQIPPQRGERMEHQQGRDPTKQGEQGSGPLLQRSEFVAAQGMDDLRRTATETKEGPAFRYRYLKEATDDFSDRELKGLQDSLSRSRSSGDVAQLQQSLITPPGSTAAEISARQLPVEEGSLRQAAPDWSLPVAVTPESSLAKVERSLRSLLKGADLPTDRSATTFIGGATMEQMMMVLATITSKVSSTNAKELVKSQHIQATAVDNITKMHLANVVEEQKKSGGAACYC
jgi:hypothetical protein